ncbi:MAG: hypothetical protein F7C38_05020 [Desulfurococcales archaeon]|nr:hypothetical protein [Desulfurococcales archaeon]
MIDATQALGVAGMLLVFASFTVRNWLWLYTLNLAGTLLLDLYAVLQGDPVFTLLETGIALFLLYRVGNELRVRRLEKRVRGRNHSSTSGG